VEPSPSIVSSPITCRSSVIAARPLASTASSAARASSGVASMTFRAAPAWITITLTLWVTTSCSSRAIRARSSSVAWRSASICSRSIADIRARPSSACCFHRRKPSAATAIGSRIRNGTALPDTELASDCSPAWRIAAMGRLANAGTLYGLKTAAL
jgi:hypothetical protein